MKLEITSSMEAVNIEGTPQTPKVVLDPKNNIFEISGKSVFVKDVDQFYDPILNWLEKDKLTPIEKPTFVFKLDFFDIESSKSILDILTKLEEANEEHKGISVEWHYQEDDEDMEEAGEEFVELVEGLPFKHVSYN